MVKYFIIIAYLQISNGCCIITIETHSVKALRTMTSRAACTGRRRIESKEPLAQATHGTQCAQIVQCDQPKARGEIRTTQCVANLMDRSRNDYEPACADSNSFS